MQGAGWFGRIARLMALAVAGAAIAILLGPARAQRFSESAPQTLVHEPAAATLPPATAPGSWAFATAGWYIRVDGVVVQPPVLPEHRAPRKPVTSAFPISPFDPVIVQHARAEGFDWRLIAALIFEESGFNPTSRSDKGAYGLMQVRPIAAEVVGASQFETPDDNVRTGVRYLRHLERMFRGVPERDRLRIVLAAYNMGPGHIQDAQMLAQALGADPYRWGNGLQVILPLLERPAIYTRLPNGFAKGHETVAYVQRILDRYRQYKLKAAAAPETAPASDSDSSDG
jgi:soluble lytic murein transglycosylase-like protein